MNPVTQQARHTWQEDSMKLTTGNRIDSVLAAIKDAPSVHEIAAMMKALRRGEDATVVIGPYRLHFDILEIVEPERQGLLKVQDLNLSSALRVVELIPAGERHGVLVTRIDGVNDAQLQTAHFGAGTPLTTEEVREGLRSDVDKLQEAGLWNQSFQRGGTWLLNPETKRVIISSWAQVAPADQNTLQAGCEQVLRMIDHA